MASKNETDVKEGLNDLCSRLSISDDTAQKALDLLTKFAVVNTTNSKEHAPFLWPICALYISSLSTQTRVPLDQMLQQRNTRLYDFFAPLQIFVEALHLDHKIVENLQYKYIVLTLLYQKYEQLFAHFCKKEEPRIGEKIYRVGWILFLIAKSKLLGSPGDLVQSLHLLFCVMNLLVIHVPDSIRILSLKDILQSTRDKFKDPHADSLMFICCINHANYGQVKQFQDGTFNVWLKMQGINSVIVYNPAKLPTEPSLAGEFFLGGLLDTHLLENEKKLSTEYEIMLYESCDFNERLFIERNFQLQSPKQIQLRTPASGNVLLTPAKAMLNTDDWFIKTYSRMSAEPPVSIKLYAPPAEDAEQAVEQLSVKVDALLASPKFPNEFDAERKSVTKKIFYRTLESLLSSESKRLNRKDFRALLQNDIFVKSLMACSVEIVMSAYRITPPLTKFPWILNLFELTSFDFYTIIESVVMNQPEPKFPRPIIKHLIRIEERILEELAWQEGSTVFTGLNTLTHQKNQPNNLAEQLMTVMSANVKMPSSSSSTTMSTPMKRMGITMTGVQMFASPSKPTRFESSSSTTTTTTSPPTPSSRHQNPQQFPQQHDRLAKRVEMFVRKVAYMASLRIQELCRDLSANPFLTSPLGKTGKSGNLAGPNAHLFTVQHVPEKIITQVEYALIQILTQKPTLMLNRHLDQLLLSILYGVAKVNQFNLSFKEIIEKYKQQPQAQPQTYYKVRISDSENAKFNLNLSPTLPNPSDTITAISSTSPPLTVDIIRFYNTVFLDEMEAFLCENEAKFSDDISRKRSADRMDENSSSSTLLDLRTASPFNFRLHKSPQKIRTLTVSPRRTPLLLRERSNMRSVIIGTPGASPRRDFSQINSKLNATPGTPSGPESRVGGNGTPLRSVKKQLFPEGNGGGGGINAMDISGSGPGPGGGLGGMGGAGGIALTMPSFAMQRATTRVQAQLFPPTILSQPLPLAPLPVPSSSSSTTTTTAIEATVVDTDEEMKDATRKGQKRPREGEPNEPNKKAK